MKWSKSKLKMYRDCSHKFKLQFIDNIPQGPSHPDLEKGIKLHDFFDRFYKNFENDVDVAMNKTLKEMGITKEFTIKYLKHFTSFRDFNVKRLKDKDSFMPVFAEMKLDFGNWTGTVDRVDKINGEYLLLDYKSSTGVEIDSYLDELYIYTYLLEQTKGIKIDYIGIFFTGNYSVSTRKLDRTHFEERMRIIEEEIKFYEKQIEAGVFVVKPAFYCRWCPYQDTEHCTSEMRGEPF